MIDKGYGKAEALTLAVWLPPALPHVMEVVGAGAGWGLIRTWPQLALFALLTIPA